MPTQLGARNNHVMSQDIEMLYREDSRHTLLGLGIWIAQDADAASLFVSCTQVSPLEKIPGIHYWG